MGSGTFKALLHGSVAAIGLVCGGTAWAQARTFDVPSDRAVNSIPEFARQAGLQIIAPADQLQGVKTPAIKGNIDIEVALNELLQGSGVEVASNDGVTVVLKASPKNVQAAQNERAATLANMDAEAVTVTA